MTKLMKKANKGKKKYFLEDEFWETISPSSIYKPRTPLVKKEYTYKSSGA
jgi:hypothetical protein